MLFMNILLRHIIMKIFNYNLDFSTLQNYWQASVDRRLLTDICFLAAISLNIGFGHNLNISGDTPMRVENNDIVDVFIESS